MNNDQHTYIFFLIVLLLCNCNPKHHSEKIPNKLADPFAFTIIKPSDNRLVSSLYGNFDRKFPDYSSVMQPVKNTKLCQRLQLASSAEELASAVYYIIKSNNNNDIACSAALIHAKEQKIRSAALYIIGKKYYYPSKRQILDVLSGRDSHPLDEIGPNLKYWVKHHECCMSKPKRHFLNINQGAKIMALKAAYFLRITEAAKYISQYLSHSDLIVFTFAWDFAFWNPNAIVTEQVLYLFSSKQKRYRDQGLKYFTLHFDKRAKDTVLFWFTQYQLKKELNKNYNKGNIYSKDYQLYKANLVYNFETTIKKYLTRIHKDILNSQVEPISSKDNEFLLMSNSIYKIKNSFILNETLKTIKKLKKNIINYNQKMDHLFYTLSGYDDPRIALAVKPYIFSNNVMLISQGLKALRSCTDERALYYKQLNLNSREDRIKNRTINMTENSPSFGAWDKFVRSVRFIFE